MQKSKLHFSSLATALLYTLMVGHPVLADDTEVLIGPGGQAWATPNVLFIMDTSGSMGGNIAGGTPTTTDPSRLSLVQGVFADLMNNESYHGINVGLMRFDNSGHGGYFVTPMQELNSSTQDGIIAASNAFTAGGNTPLSETLYETARFFGGLSVDYGDSSTPGTNHPEVINGSNYISPITSQCQENFVILLTDGQPTSDTEADASIQTLTGSACNGNCLDEVAGYLHNEDQNGIAGSHVDTYTIGFTTSQVLLQETATAGDGEYVMASSEEGLRIAFEDFLDTISETNDTFSPPAMAANAFNNVSHYNKLYFAMFEPAANPKWIGNVKPYTLNDDYQIAGVGGAVAVNDRGFFLPGSRSYWSDTADGGSIAGGGANGQLPAEGDRNLYTYTGDYSGSGSLTLSAASNALSIDNVSLTGNLLGLTGTTAEIETELTSILSTIRDADLGAPLHSQPALVTYGINDDGSPDLTLFVATNDGFLHAFNGSTNLTDSTRGEERFAFIPQELLQNLPTLANGNGTHPYGLDGNITVWAQESDTDDDHAFEGDDEHVYVYVGMRRGGGNYYALDVTNRDEPTLKWVIKGGADGTPGFAELGQSWSKPMLTTIRYGTSSRKVLIFGGGYDTAQDANPLNTDDSIGRAIFIVDADTGAKLWQADSTVISTMTNSIPSDVRLLDSNLDGYTDRLYVGDMRGQIFRIDLQATLAGSSGVRLANLGGSTEANNRRFYYAPDVVVTQQAGSSPYISLNIGSGYRSHPLNPLNANGTAAPRVNDRFYSLRDNLGETVATITDPDDLFDATNTLVITAADLTNGWYITLGNGNGEKVLAPAMTLNGEIFFTTYTPPETVDSTDCAPPPGVGRLYRVSLFDATPPVTHATEADADGNIPDSTTADRVTTLDRPGIPSEPTAMFRKVTNEDGTDGGVELIRCVGTECELDRGGIKMEETYWRDEG